jgi:hypothetical protein
MNEVHRRIARGRGYASRLAFALLLGPLAALASPMSAPDAKARADAAATTPMSSGSCVSRTAEWSIAAESAS